VNDFGFPLLAHDCFNNPKAITRWSKLVENRKVRYLLKTLTAVMEDAPLLAEQNPTTHHNFMMTGQNFILNFVSTIRSLLNPYEVILQLQMEQFLIAIEAINKSEEFLELMIWALKAINTHFINEDYESRIRHFKINRLADVVLYEILIKYGIQDKMLELSIGEVLPTDKFGCKTPIHYARNSFRTHSKRRNS
jgi:hypothetical protein